MVAKGMSTGEFAVELNQFGDATSNQLMTRCGKRKRARLVATFMRSRLNHDRRFATSVGGFVGFHNQPPSVAL